MAEHHSLGLQGHRCGEHLTWSKEAMTVNTGEEWYVNTDQYLSEPLYICKQMPVVVGDTKRYVRT